MPAAAAPVRRHHRHRDPVRPDPAARARRADHGAWFPVLPALIPILLLSVGPLLYGIALAFTDAQSGRTAPTQWVGLLNFQDLLHDRLFWESFRIGLLWAVGVTVPQFLLALGLALLLNQNLRFRWLARSLAITEPYLLRCPEGGRIPLVGDGVGRCDGIRLLMPSSRAAGSTAGLAGSDVCGADVRPLGSNPVPRLDRDGYRR